VSKEIWLGPLLGNNRARLIERCAELVSRNKANSFLYLAASHPLLEIVTQGILDGDRNRGVWGELPVYLFRGFVRRLLSSAVNEAGQLLPPRVPIDQEELPLKRSLVSQILTRLMGLGQLKAIAPLAGREGCVNTIATLIGEIERAAMTPAELHKIIADREKDLDASKPRSAQASALVPRQIDFDKEVALIYVAYCELLDRHHLTEADADQARALAVLKGELDGQTLQIPVLADVQLLVLDGFFDFTPVQGEILRQLIPRIPEVLVNLNHDERNPEIFLPFQRTIEQLSSVAPFEKKWSTQHVVPTLGALAGLREKLFNPSMPGTARIAGSPSGQPAWGAILRASSDGIPQPATGAFDPQNVVPSVESTQDACGPRQDEIKYWECGDRDTEIHAVAKEVKRLVLIEGFNLADIALVVRQRAAYAETIARVMREELLPCNLESRIDVNDIPAVRAALKLFAILEELSRADSTNPRTSELADLIKSEYFRLNHDDLAALSTRFDTEYSELLRENDQALEAKQEQLKHRYRVGRWDADALENAFAYVGSELRVSDWLARARKLIAELPGAAATKQLLNIDSGEQARDPDEADQIENAETAKVESADVEKKRRPSRDIHPATLAWASLVMQTFAERIQAVPREGRPPELRLALIKMLEQFSFREQIAGPIRNSVADRELPQAMLNYNSLEALRRAMVAAIKSIEVAATLSPGTAGIAGSPSGQPVWGAILPAVTDGSSQLTTEPFDPQEVVPPVESTQDACGPRTRLSTFIEEVRRCLSSQSQVLGAADARGLRVLEATDVRGLRFRAVFIAGLVEGGFPLRAARDWIYPHEERERLKQYGLMLEDISPATLLKEEHYFYQAACRATERLYLSRPLLLEDDSETVASYYIDELRRAIAPYAIEAQPLRRDYEGNGLGQVSRTGELNVGLVRQQERHIHRGEKRELLPEPRIKRLLTLARNDSLLSKSALRRIEIERERAGDSFGPYDGAITNPDLIALLNQRFGADFVHSASGLSIYGNCAYRFFGQRVLKLEPRGEAALDLQAIDAGKLLHDILRRFFEQHRRQPLHELDREALQTELRELADKVFDEHEHVVPPLNKEIWKIDREIRKILLDQVLMYELEMQEKAAAHKVLPAYFEVGFGMKSGTRDPGSSVEPLELSRSTFVGEETIKVSGQIDRVDVSSDKTLVAYDYKLSTGSSIDDIRSGRSLQLPIYLEALERLLLPDHTIAGGGYYVIRGGNERRNKGLHRASALQYSGISNRVSSVMADDEWQRIRAEVIAKIWDFLDHIRSGDFSVNPSEKQKTCRFCDFAAVCRYDRYRIDRKK
jgi:ATP-dependent helicase/DNAse subunit B